MTEPAKPLEPHELRTLANALTTITGPLNLWGELQDTLLRQDRRSKGGMRIRRPKPGPAWPIHVGAHDAMLRIENALVTAVPESEAGSVQAMARWLCRNMPELARRPDARQCWEALIDAIDFGISVIDLPPEDAITWTADRLEQANRTVMTSDQIAALAPKIGAQGLNRQRISRLVKAGHLRPTGTLDSGTRLYRLGDVLKAHQTAPRRNTVA